MTVDASAATSRKLMPKTVIEGRRVLMTTSSPPTRRIGAIVVAGGFGVLVWMVADHRRAPDLSPSGRLAWSLSLLIAVVFIARGMYLGRPVTSMHAAVALAMVVSGIGVRLLGLATGGDALIAAAGLALMSPLPSRPDPESLSTVWPLIEATQGDPLAPFAMQSSKSVFADASGTAAIAYRTRLGFAVVSGDPIGRSDRFAALVAEFAVMCRRRGWRITVLGCGQCRAALWRNAAVVGQTLRAVPIGRDVVVDVAGFTMTGRRYRNLRQAVARTRNCGITTEVVAEQALDPTLKAELTDVLYASRRDAHLERGFSMMLGDVLQGRCPGVQIIVARDRHGQVQGFQRYAVSGAGSDVSLDLPWRRPGAPNGIDERLTVDMIAWSRGRGARRLSLAFAPFPELFDASDRTPMQRLYYALIHLGDPLIRLESLYRYVRKFHASGQRRYVLVSALHIPVALAVLLSLEFAPSRRRPRAHPPVSSNPQGRKQMTIGAATRRCQQRERNSPMTHSVLTDDQIAALTPGQRRDLIRRLERPVEEAWPTGFLAIFRRAHLGVMTAGVLFMIPWIVYLGFTLPVTYTVRDWPLTWVGFDSLLVAFMAATAVLAWLHRQLLMLTAFTTGILLICDAWFDITMASAAELRAAVLTAALGGLPLAFVLIAGTVSLLRFNATRTWLLAPGQSLWRLPLAP